MKNSAPELKIWDPVVRTFHWGVAAGFLLNYFIIEDGSDLHEWTGYFVGSLLIPRLVWGIIGSKNARFVNFWPTPQGIREHLSELASGQIDPKSGHNPAGAVMIFLMMTLLALTCLSGWAMENIDAFWGEDWLEELHELFAGTTLFAVCVHVPAVLLIQWWTQTPLVRPMWSGKRRVPIDSEPNN